MKKIVFLLAINIFFTSAYSKQPDKALNDLKQAIKNKDIYINAKEERIKNIKGLYAVPNLDDLQEYDLNTLLLAEYWKYKTDSAVAYAEKNVDIAIRLNEQELINVSKIYLAPLYSTSGLYIESLFTLQSIDKNTLKDSLKAEYYYAYHLLYNHYGQGSNNVKYFTTAELYRDSLLTLESLSEDGKEAISIQQDIYNNPNYERAEKYLLKEFDGLVDTSPNYAITAFHLGSIYERQGKVELQKQYYAMSAISDIKTTTRDNAAFQSLALILYQTGDIDFAQECARMSMEDAVNCNVRYRTIDGANSYPIITGTYQQKEKQARSMLSTLLFIISILGLFSFFSAIFIYKQIKKLSKTRRELKNKNEDLHSSNSSLKNANDLLHEANHIKEEYIAYSFDIYSSYISKIETFNNKVYKKIQTNNIKEIVKLISSTDLINEELKEFYDNFDRIFLKIYPNFVTDFNNLLLDEERIELKTTDSLTPELRIYALIRLGITDSTKIAKYLHYSLSTIYNYKAKMRNKAAVSRDEFEDHVAKISSQPL